MKCAALESFAVGVPCFLSTYAQAITFSRRFVRFMVTGLPLTVRQLGFSFAGAAYDGDNVTRDDVVLAVGRFPWDEVVEILRNTRWIRRLVFELGWQGPREYVTWDDELVELVLSKLNVISGKSRIPLDGTCD